MFTRLTDAGDAVRKCTSNQPAHVKAALVGNTLFWVNESSSMAEITIKGFDAREVRIMEENTIEGDRECGVVMKLDPDNPHFTAPPMSFGYAR